MTKVRMIFEVYKHKNKDGVLPVSLCKVCGTTVSPVFYKGWVTDAFSRADDEYLGIYCKECKEVLLLNIR